jgi:phage gpG-like protein
MPSLRFIIDTSGVTDALNTFRQRFTASTPGPMRDAFKRANLRWMNFIQRRFIAAARGDGTWQPLAQSTKLARLRRTFTNYGRRVKDILSGGPPTAAQAEQVAKLRGKRAAEGRKFKRQLAATGKQTRQEQIAALLEGHTFEILRDTGTLFNSLTTGSPNSVEAFDGLSMSLGTAVNYARFHQSPEIPGRPPERVIFVLPDEGTRAAMRADLERGAMEVARQAGLA